MDQGNLGHGFSLHMKGFSNSVISVGVLGHKNIDAHTPFEQAADNIHHGIHAARPDPESNFWVTPQLDLYSKAIKAYTNSNRNRTLKIEILWAGRCCGDVFEVVNNDGNRVVFFVRHAGFAVSVMMMIRLNLSVTMIPRNLQTTTIRETAKFLTTR